MKSFPVKITAIRGSHKTLAGVHIGRCTIDELGREVGLMEGLEWVPDDVYIARNGSPYAEQQQHEGLYKEIALEQLEPWRTVAGMAWRLDW